MMRANWMCILAAAVAASCGGAKGPTTTTTADTAGKPMPPTVNATPATVAQPATTNKPATAQPKLVPSPLANDTTKTTIHRLSNGMTVYISPDKQEPSVVAYVAVHAGGSYESRSSTGLAHYLVHMLVKGASKR